MTDPTTGLVSDLRALGNGESLKDRAKEQMSRLALSDNDWLRLLALARAMAIITSSETRVGDQEGSR